MKSGQKKLIVGPMSDKFFSLFGKIVLVLIIVGSVAFAAFYFGKNYSKPSPSPTATSQTEPAAATIASQSAPNPIVSSPAPSKIGKKMISAGVASGLSFSLYTLDLPGDWTFSQEHDDPTLYDKLTMKKGAYELSIFQGATGGAMCLYPGDPDFEGPSSRFTTYVEFTNSDGKTFRRSGNDIESGGIKGFTVCQKSPDGGWGQPTVFGHTSYKMPSSYDETILKEMDEMVASLKKK